MITFFFRTTSLKREEAIKLHELHEIKMGEFEDNIPKREG